MCEIRFAAALDAATEIIELVGCGDESKAVRLGQIAFLILAGIYRCEGRIADATPTQIFCPGCLTPVPQAASRPDHCPSCWRQLPGAEAAGVN